MSYFHCFSLFIFQVLFDCFSNRHVQALDWRTEPNAYRAAIKQGNISIIRSILQHRLDVMDEDKHKLEVHRIIHQSIIDIIDTVDKHPKKTKEQLAILREIMKFWCACEIDIQTLEADRPALIHSVMICSTHDPRRLGVVYTLLKGGNKF